MNSKILLAAGAGAVTSFFLGWLVYGMALMGLMESNTTPYVGLTKDPPILVGIFLSGLCMAWLMAFIFYRWANITGFSKGFVGGFIIGLPIVLSMDLSFYSFFNLYTTTWLAIDVVVTALFHAVIGGVVGMVLGMGKKPQPT